MPLGVQTMLSELCSSMCPDLDQKGDGLIHLTRRKHERLFACSVVDELKDEHWHMD